MLPEFLNVDLELESCDSLDLIAREFGDQVHILHNGPLRKIPYLLAVEVYAGHENDPESIIEVFCDLIDRLAPKAKKVWQKARVRRFDIGIESGTPEPIFGALCLSLSPATLKRVAALGAEVVITVYPPRRTAPKKRAKKKKAGK